MKVSTEKIIDQLPMLEQFLQSNEGASLSDEVLSKLSDVEQVFYVWHGFLKIPKK